MITLGRIPRPARRARSDVMARSPRGDIRHWQIGPKIRVGGSIGKVGQNIKNTVTKAVTDTGHAVGDVASNKWVQGGLAAALAATGVGAPAAAAIMAATKGGGALLKKGGNIGDGLTGAVQGAAAGYGAAKAGSLVRGGIDALKSGTGGSALDRLKGLVTGGGSDGTGNFGMAGDLAGKLTGGGGMPGAGGDAGGGGGGGGGGGNGLLDTLLMGGSLAAGVANKQRQEGFQTRAASYATDPYDAKASLRSKAIAGLSDDAAGPDLGDIFSNPGNVYDRQKRGMTPLSTRTPAAAAMTQGTALSNRLAARVPAQPPQASQPTQAVV